MCGCDILQDNLMIKKIFFKCSMTENGGLGEGGKEEGGGQGEQDSTVQGTVNYSTVHYNIIKEISKRTNPHFLNSTFQKRENISFSKFTIRHSSSVWYVCQFSDFFCNDPF